MQGSNLRLPACEAVLINDVLSVTSGKGHRYREKYEGYCLVDQQEDLLP